jgi:P27 family predicted phage terminase small subunit
VRGRPPKPTALRVLQGNRSHRPLNTEEPQPPGGRPPRPEGYGSTFEAAWDELLGHIEMMKVLTVVDGPSLEACALALAEMRDIARLLQKEGRFYTTTNADGLTMKRVHPLVAVYADAQRRFATFSAKFGLSPADRVRVRAKPPSARQDGVRDFVFGGGRAPKPHAG